MDISKLFNPAGKRLDISQYTGSDDFVTLKVIPMTVKYELYANSTNGVDIQKAAEILTKKGLPLKEIAAELETNPNKIYEILNESELKEVIKDVDLAQNVKYKIKVLRNGVDKNNHSFTNGNGKSVDLDSEFWENLGTYVNPLFEFIYSEVEKYQKEYSLGEQTGKISNTRS